MITETCKSNFQMLISLFVLSSVNYQPGNGQGCGKENHVVTPRAVGGHDALLGRWPWMVRLFVGMDKLCGGSLIDPQHVLTSAHCMFRQKPGFIVKIGDHRLDNENPEEVTLVPVIKIKIHPQFSWHFGDYDLALLMLARPVSQTHICLPLENSLQDGEIATLIGWGQLSMTGPKSKLLQEVELPVVSKNCTAEYLICAGEKGKDLCLGDSGGPLMIKKRGRWIQIGVASYFTKVCGEAPSVYVRLDHPGAMRWLKNSLKD